MDDTKTLESIEQKLDIMIKILAKQHVQNKSRREQVVELENMGLSRKEIIDLTGITANNLRVILHHSKKTKERREKDGKATVRDDL